MKKTFQEFMNEKNPNWQQVLPMETITKLKELYDLKTYYEERNKTLMQRQFTSSAGIDYSTDYEKNNQELGNIYNQINEMTASLTVTNTITNENVRSM